MRAYRRFAVVTAGVICVAVSVAVLAAMRHTTPPTVVNQVIPAATPAARQAAAHENAFAFDLLRTVDRDSNTGNTFLSPLSIDQAVSMLDAGAAGQTRAEIDKALHSGNAAPDALLQAAALRNRLLAQGEGPNPSVEITIANALWANRGVVFHPTFAAACGSQLGAKASTLDFYQPSAAATINRWVAIETRGKIVSIVTPTILANASAVLTNAVYFHGRWDSPFDASDTTDAVFHTASGAAKTLPMMTQTDRFMAAQTDALQAVALPYGHSRLSMVVVLPRSGRSLHALAQSLTPAEWDRLASSLQKTNVQLFLPRFHIDYSASLNRSLDALGMEGAFTPAADFSPMAGAGLFVSSVIHKTTLDVDEKGTVATAVTGIMMQTMSVEIPVKPITIRVDHPFLCAIRDDDTGALLFLGCVRDPQPIH